MEQDFGEMRKAPYFQAFFPFRPKEGCSSIVELVNDILFDIPSLVGLGKCRSHDLQLLYKMIKLSKIID
jgi:hypothetical protein